MRSTYSSSLFVLCAALLSAGCSIGEKNTVEQVDQVDAAAHTRHCFRNEYPFDDQPDQKDVEELTIEVEGQRAVGEYNWLPAFKDQRVGRFEGLFDGRLVIASYESTQEGQTTVVTISITLQSDEVVVEGVKPDLGLNATIARVDC